MEFSSVLFLCFFFPLFYLVYYSIPNKWKKIWLLIGSIFFLICGRNSFFWYSVIVTFITYFVMYYFYRLPRNISKKKIVIWTILLELIIWYFFAKDFEFGIYPFYYTVMLLQNWISLLDYQRKKRLPKLFDYILYIVCFSKLLFGPIISYFDMELEERKCSKELFITGCLLFFKGIFLHVLLVNPLLQLQTELLLLSTSIFSSLVLLLATMLAVFLFMEGYSNISVGLGNMLGFHFQRDFDMNYSLSQFLRNWHFSLTSFWRSITSNLLLCMIFLSLSYGINMNLLFWFLFIGLGIKIETKILKSKNFIFSLLWTFFSFTFLVRPNLEGIKVSILSLVSNPLVSKNDLYLWKSYFPLLLISTIVCFKIGNKIIYSLKKKVWFQILIDIGYFLLLVMTLTFLVLETKNHIWMFQI